MRPIIVAADAADWRAFITLAAAEGWRVPQTELAFHQRSGASQALALRVDGASCGLVTAVRHGTSAWIGNLIVAPAVRGQGFGAALFARSITELRTAGAQALWLTASAQGAPLYRGHGFHTVNRVERWVRSSGWGESGRSPLIIPTGGATDRIVWGDDRHQLLRHLEAGGTWLRQGGSLALLQRGADLQQIGPWYGSPHRTDDMTLLQELIAAASARTELVVDLLAATGREWLLAELGFRPIGTTELMLCGAAEVQWSRLLALATLGSCG